MLKIVFLHGLTGSKNNFEYLEKEFPDYQTLSLDLLGFGNETKPNIDYNLTDFIKFLDAKLNLSEENNTQYVLIGHSFGSLLAKELIKKYPHKIRRAFLIAYPFNEKDKVLRNRSFFDELYARGMWWTKVICEMRIIFKYLFLPFIFLFRYKYRKSYLDYFKHTYQSAFGTLHNTILKDKKDDLFNISDKIVFINGQKDKSTDLEFAKKFKHYVLKSMGHLFFNHERDIAKIIKLNLDC